MSDIQVRLIAALAGRYSIERELGAGGMATVYLAHDLRHERDVAIKVLHPDLGAALGGERFLTEIRTTARLQHPHILPLLDSGEADGLLYYVMPLVTGETLRSRLERERQLSIADAVRIAREIASALDYAHRQNVIHRDIKPENVMLVPDVDDDGEPCDLVKVCDFGLAKMRDPVPGEEITIVGMLCGSPAYMSPEQTRGEPLDMRTDIYSLGVTLFEALTGALPFDAYSIAELFLKKGIEPPRRVSSIVAIDPLLDDIVYRAMATRPTDRHESAKELRIELRTAREQLEDAPDVPSIEGG
jgi:eukaryotic-like serine/threonine-protein kinase